MKQWSFLLLGATGAVGSEVLALALADPRVRRVVAPARKALPAHEKLLNPIVDFAQLPDAGWWEADACICSLGTTLRLADSAEAFERVDRHFVVEAASRARAAGTPCFAYNSSLGADEKARSFYLRIKGLTEKDLEGLGFTSLTHVRPSLLDSGPRPDSRPGERLMLAISRPIKFLLPKSIRPVSTQAVARALLSAAEQARPGRHYVESREIFAA
jgi:uncharacterized protein YbjT (DUF2867 family)